MDDKPSINGWTPPVIYNISSDSYRAATQEDVDRMQTDLMRLSAFFNQMRQAVIDIDGSTRTSRTLAKPGDHP